eukprot:6213947-Pleurochrysis_carterae.AAC.4
MQFEAIPPIFTARSDQVFRATRSETRTPSLGVYRPFYTLRDLPGAIVIGAAQARGLGRAWVVAQGGGAQWAKVAMIMSGFQELGERSATAPQICTPRESKTANRACECRIANERRARRQFISKCRARARGEMALTSVYAEEGICGNNIPRDPIGCIRSAAIFYVPVATNVKTIVYMGLRATLGWWSAGERDDTVGSGGTAEGSAPRAEVRGSQRVHQPDRIGGPTAHAPPPLVAMYAGKGPERAREGGRLDPPRLGAFSPISKERRVRVGPRGRWATPTPAQILSIRISKTELYQGDVNQSVKCDVTL